MDCCLTCSFHPQHNILTHQTPGRSRIKHHFCRHLSLLSHDYGSAVFHHGHDDHLCVWAYFWQGRWLPDATASRSFSCGQSIATCPQVQRTRRSPTCGLCGLGQSRCRCWLSVASSNHSYCDPTTSSPPFGMIAHSLGVRHVIQHVIQPLVPTGRYCYMNHLQKNSRCCSIAESWSASSAADH